ncbi:MAG: hypothetical protein AAGD25_06555 [Cyanobacteria bacterium P01_F01_bin.150]
MKNLTNHEIAKRIVDRCKNERHPYNRAKYYAEHCPHAVGGRFGDPPLWEAYLIAVQMMKQSGIENAKRGSLTNLTKKERKQIRDAARHLCKYLTEFAGRPVTLDRQPIRPDKDMGLYCSICVQRDRAWTSFAPISVDTLRRYMAMDDGDKRISAFKIAQQLFGRDELIKRNIDVIKADLEALLQ